MKIKIIAVVLLSLLICTSCTLRRGDVGGGLDGGLDGEGDSMGLGGNIFDENTENSPLGGDDDSFGEEISSTGAYDGYFEEESTEYEISYTSGTEGAYSVDGSTITFSNITEDSEYSISGKFSGNIVIDMGDDYKFELVFANFSLVCDSTNPITILSGDKVSLSAKKETKNYIYDTRDAIGDDDTLYSAAVYSKVDLKLCGKGELTVISENNNGIHTKDDLEVKNLTLFVSCVDNALKGNDGVEIESGSTTLIATAGDGIKTKNSDLSKKGNQRGIVKISGGEHTIYAACDGIDASYDVMIEGDSTTLNIYTDKYSNYSSEIIDTSEDQYYIRYTSKNYNYSVKYINSQTGEFKWVNAKYDSQVSGGRTSYYYYTFDKLTGYDKIKFFIYSSGMEQGQEEDYEIASDEMTISDSYDTIAISNKGYTWTNYTTTQNPSFGGGMGGFGGGMGGFGGMQDGNTEKGDHSTKGIKADNEIIVSDGVINIKSYDDAIHANSDVELENGETPTGNVTINGGTLTLYSNDDGIHADGTLSITSGTVSVTHSYEGLEGNIVNISGGDISVLASDDGINGVATSGTAISISGGNIYVYCSGDGIDSNSRTSYGGIEFSGGNTVIVSTSGGDSAIDTEDGYKYTGGYVVAIMPNRGMTSEAIHCQNFSSIGKTSRENLSKGTYLVVDMGNVTATVKMPVALQSYVIVLGSSSASIKTETSSNATLNSDGVCWN